MKNLATLQGRLAEEPVLKSVGNTYVCNINIVSNDTYKGKTSTIYMPCVFWGKQAEFICNYFTKGQEIIVDGKLIQNDWVDNHQQKRKDIKLNVTSCNFCGNKKNNQSYSSTKTELQQSPEQQIAQAEPEEQKKMKKKLLIQTNFLVLMVMKVTFRIRKRVILWEKKLKIY